MAMSAKRERGGTPVSLARIRHHAPLGQPVTEPAKCLLDALTIEQRRRFAHAASIS
jgi:hypothetical protein